MNDENKATPDELLTGLYVRAEQTRLPHESSYDVDAELQRFSGWLEDTAGSAPTDSGHATPAGALMRASTREAERAATGSSPGPQLASTFWGMLGYAERGALLATAEPVTYPPSTYIFREGDRSSFALVIAKGWAKVASGEPRANEMTLALRREGDLVGTSALADSPRSAAVVALSEVHALSISTPRFSALLHEHPNVDQALRRTLRGRRIESDRMRVDIAKTTSDKRLARLFLTLAGSFGERSESDVVLDIPLSQEECGQLICASTATVQRTLRQWRRRGILSTSYRRHTLLDLTALAMIAAHPRPEVALPAETRRERHLSLTGGVSPGRVSAPRGGGDHSGGTAFWEALTADERRAFERVAEERIFAAGSTLIHEGDRGDHIILIRDGWTKICVDEQGRERVIAERGPGQLVGERAALQVNLRSASVIALEIVNTLIMRTEDFADFVGAHPRVLEIIEGQVYDRLTSPVPGFRRHADRPLDREGRHRWPTWAGPFNGENCTVMFVDVAGFSARVCDDADRLIVRGALNAMMREVFEAQGIASESLHVEDRGDGLLVIVPAHVPTRAVLDGLPTRLALALRRHNRRSAPPIRLRLAAGVGPVTTDAVGSGGEVIVRTARLLDAPVLRRGLATGDADLGVIVSDFVYDSVVRHGDPDHFAPVTVQVKEASLHAWMWLNAQQSPAVPLKA